MTILLIVNEKSTTNSKLNLTDIYNQLAKIAPVILKKTTSKGEGEYLGAWGKRQQFKYIIICGGDGTINEVINGLMKKYIPGKIPTIGLIPAGNGNVLAKNLRVPTDYKLALQLIINGIATSKIQSISLGKIAGNYFTSNAGLGFDADVVRRVAEARDKKGKVSNFTYIYQGIKEFINFPREKNRISLHLKSRQSSSLFSIKNTIINNGPAWTYNKNKPFVTNPHTDFNSGLGICAFKRATRRQLLKFLFYLSSSKPIDNNANILLVDHIKDFTLVCDSPISLQLDGEFLGKFTHLDVTYVSCAVDFLVGN